MAGAQGDSWYGDVDMPAGIAARLWSLSRNNNSSGSNSWRAVHEPDTAWTASSPYSLSSHENPVSISYSKCALVCQGAKPVLLMSTVSLVSENTAGNLRDGDLTWTDKICRSHECLLVQGGRF